MGSTQTANAPSRSAEHETIHYWMPDARCWVLGAGCWTVFFASGAPPHPCSCPLQLRPRLRRRRVRPPFADQGNLYITLSPSNAAGVCHPADTWTHDVLTACTLQSPDDAAGLGPKHAPFHSTHGPACSPFAQRSERASRTGNPLRDRPDVDSRYRLHVWCALFPIQHLVASCSVVDGPRARLHVASSSERAASSHLASPRRLTSPTPKAQGDKGRLEGCVQYARHRAVCALNLCTSNQPAVADTNPPSLVQPTALVPSILEESPPIVL